MSIESIVNSEVSSIIFIRDYIQITLEDEEETSTLTTYRLPTVIINGELFDSETDGYRDALCSLINMVVKKSEVVEKKFINIYFDESRKVVLSVSLSDDLDDELPEIAMFTRGKEITVW